MWSADADPQAASNLWTVLAVLAGSPLVGGLVLGVRRWRKPSRPEAEPVAEAVVETVEDWMRDRITALEVETEEKDREIVRLTRLLATCQAERAMLRTQLGAARD